MRTSECHCSLSSILKDGSDVHSFSACDKGNPMNIRAIIKFTEFSSR